MTVGISTVIYKRHGFRYRSRRCFIRDFCPRLAMLFALHVPDHTLSTEVSLLAAVAAAIVAVAGLRRITKDIERPSFGMFAAVTALVFAVQMLNFPLLDGITSGHVLGAASAVILLGPVFGIASLTLVLVVQAVALGDGGMTALGANLLNMALIAPIVAFGAYRSLERRGTLVAAAVAGWTSTVAAALACSIELAASGVGSFGPTAAALVGQHALLGFVEGAFTVAIVFATLQPIAIARRLQIATLAAAAVVVFALTPLASELPDTLEVVLAAVR